MTRDEWIARFAAELGVDPPDEDTVEALLALAGTAAHASERTAAPIACYLVGVAGTRPVEAAATAAAVAPPSA
jgi:C4-dicarboxylate transporter